MPNSPKIKQFFKKFEIFIKCINHPKWVDSADCSQLQVFMDTAEEIEKNVEVFKKQYQTYRLHKVMKRYWEKKYFQPYQEDVILNPWNAAIVCLMSHGGNNELTQKFVISFITAEPLRFREICDKMILQAYVNTYVVDSVTDPFLEEPQFLANSLISMWEDSLDPEEKDVVHKIYRACDENMSLVFQVLLNLLTKAPTCSTAKVVLKTVLAKMKEESSESCFWVQFFQENHLEIIKKLCTLSENFLLGVTLFFQKFPDNVREEVDGWNINRYHGDEFSVSYTNFVTLFQYFNKCATTKIKFQALITENLAKNEKYLFWIDIQILASD